MERKDYEFIIDFYKTFYYNKTTGDSTIRRIFIPKYYNAEEELKKIDKENDRFMLYLIIGIIVGVVLIVIVILTLVLLVVTKFESKSAGNLVDNTSN